MDGRPEFSALPLTPDGTVDKEKAKDLYDRSAHVEWTPFSRSMGWDPVRSRALFPTNRWIKEKRFRLAKQHAENLQDQLEQNKPKISEDIIRTLRVYPEAHEKFLDLIQNARILLNNEVASLMVQTQENLKKLKPPPALRAGFIGDIVMLSGALGKLTESKYRSLLLSDLTIKTIETQTREEISRPPEQAIQDSSKPAFDFEIMGMENVTAKQLEDLHQRYFDRPQSLPPPPDPEDEEVEA